MDKNGLLGELIGSLCCLPGVGPKSAQRMAFQLLQYDRERGRHLANVLLEATEKIAYCRSCRTFTELDICTNCSNPARDRSLLCVVESPADVWVVDQAGFFKGTYFVLHGRLSPLDGIGPNELALDILEQRLTMGEVKEIILDTNSTVEGEATAYYISELARRCRVKATRIAHGVPMGGELEFIDSGTLNHAFNGRTVF